MEDAGKSPPERRGEDGGRERFGRLALVVDHSGMSMAAARLRELVPTFCVSSLGEIVDALMAHEQGAWSQGPQAAEAGPGALMGLDISGVPLDDTRLFATNLLGSHATGTVYVMTSAQFELFDPSLFDFVVR